MRKILTKGKGKEKIAGKEHNNKDKGGKYLTKENERRKKKR